jgi:glycosyltransferase involved in cell wall biosynthesis
MTTVATSRMLCEGPLRTPPDNRRMEKKPNRILLFRKALTTDGGAERLLFEIATWLSRNGHEVRVVVMYGVSSEKLFDGTYAAVPVTILCRGGYPSSVMKKILTSLISVRYLRRTIHAYRPDIMVGQNPSDAEILFLASLGMKLPFATFLYSSFFNFPEDGLKYLPPFRRVFNAIREKTPGHREFIPNTNPIKGTPYRLILQIRAWMSYYIVRRAAVVFSMTRRMAWENEELYGRPVIDVKGGALTGVYGTRPVKDLRERYGLPREAKVFVDVSRLVAGKRIELCIRTIAEIMKKRDDVYLVVGGRGPEKERLEALVEALGVKEHVILAGFVPEEDLPDFYASASGIMHPAWIDFDLTVMEGISFGKKVICSDDYDLTGEISVLNNKLIFGAMPNPTAMAEAVERVIAAPETSEAEVGPLLATLTWESYTRSISKYLGAACKK